MFKSAGNCRFDVTMSNLPKYRKTRVHCDFVATFTKFYYFCLISFFCQPMKSLSTIETGPNSRSNSVPTLQLLMPRCDCWDHHGDLALNTINFMKPIFLPYPVATALSWLSCDSQWETVASSCKLSVRHIFKLKIKKKVFTLYLLCF